MDNLNMVPVLDPREGKEFDVLDISDAAIGTFESEAVPIRREGWVRFTGTIVLVNAEAKILARSTSTGEFVDVMEMYFDIPLFTEDTIFEISLPTNAWEIKIEYTTFSTTNTVQLSIGVR